MFFLQFVFNFSQRKMDNVMMVELRGLQALAAVEPDFVQEIDLVGSQVRGVRA